MEVQKAKIRAVIFDLDGTLIDTEKYYRVCWPASLAEFGYHMSDEQTLSLRSLGRPFAPARLKGWFGEDFDYDRVRQRRKELFDQCLEREGLRCRPGAHALLKRLRQEGYTTAVATATDPERTDNYLKRTGLDGYFDKVISAAMVAEGKPSPDVYLYACEELGLRPAECLAVEDAPNGVLSAFRAGCRVVMVPDQTEADEEIRQYLYAVADSLEEIYGLLQADPSTSITD